MDRSCLLEDRLLFPLGNVTANGISFGVMREVDGVFETFNPLISSNEKQLLAVHAILERPPASTPFIIFGP
jgi:hypothetical protein